MRRIAIVASMVIAAGVGTAWAAGPRAGARYTGKTGAGYALTARVTGDGKGLQLDFLEVATCNNGHRKRSHAHYAKQRPSIRPDGRFDYSKTYHLGPVPGFDEKFVERQHVTGSFSSDGRTLHGRATTTDTGKTLRCTSAVSFHARQR